MLGPDCFGLVVSGETPLMISSALPAHSAPPLVLGNVKYFFSTNQAELEDWVAVITNGIDFNKLQRANAIPTSPVRQERSGSKWDAGKRYSGLDEVTSAIPAVTLADAENDTLAVEENQSVGDLAHGLVGDGNDARDGDDDDTIFRKTFSETRGTDQDAGDVTRDNDDGDSDGEVIPELLPLDPVPPGKMLSRVSVKDLPSFESASLGETSGFVHLPKEIPESDLLRSDSRHQQQQGNQESGVGKEEEEKKEDEGPAWLLDLPVQIPESVRRSLMIDRTSAVLQHGIGITGHFGPVMEGDPETRAAVQRGTVAGKGGDESGTAAGVPFLAASSVSSPGKPQKPPRASPDQRVASIRFVSTAKIPLPPADFPDTEANSQVPVQPIPTPVPVPRRKPLPRPAAPEPVAPEAAVSESAVPEPALPLVSGVGDTLQTEDPPAPVVATPPRPTVLPRPKPQLQPPQPETF